MQSNNGLYNIMNFVRMVTVADILNLSRKWEVSRNILIGPETSD